ncbi:MULTISPECIES: response regulator transcription factor [Paenibacillus]|uniref:Two component transcriptional regulator, winged helix family n=1 Tax=Paenibacillus lactis 154 TaxID=743719 RepID=G4HIG6_9BACL|nr:response regulator transcription factor [Paenibacillus lactis]EHB63139.1 two component transcriptional regulator, winged helix family [Paenibacillus lactis 154]GIO91499.1 DNA-binding response regulator [Paenibacillus lactis]
MRMLVIEDEQDLANAIEKGLEMEGFAVDIAFDGEEGCQLAEIHAYDIIILDLNLPDRSGLDVLQHIRHLSKQIRVLILTALSDTPSRVKGLNLGADDYLGKPFDFEELKARIRALLRRDLLRESPLLTYGPIELNPITKTATCAGQQLTLTRKEFAILQYFLSHPDQVISSEQLVEHVWDQHADPFSSSVRVHITTLRSKIRSVIHVNFLNTLPGYGYQLNKQIEGLPK